MGDANNREANNNRDVAGKLGRLVGSKLSKGLQSFLEGLLEGSLGPDRGGGRFPDAGIDGFLSHFVFTIQINKGRAQGEIFSYTWPAAIQSVARSQPFMFDRTSRRKAVEFPMPEGCSLPPSMSEGDFLTTPPNFFDEGKETMYLQILNLDARGQTEYGPMRCILGETFKREYEDIFQPSFGAAQSLGRSGMPAKLFFVPNGIFETPFGALHTRPKALLGAHITQVPPVGSSPSLLEPIPLDSVEELRARRGALPETPAATLLALAHPIDALLYGDNLFERVQKAIARASGRT